MAKSYRHQRRGGIAPHKYLSDAQVDQVLRYLAARSANGRTRSSVNLFIVLMLLHSGLRASELLALRLYDCPVVHGKDVLEVADGKGGICRAVDIPDWLSEVIRQFIDTCRKGARPGSILIPSEAGVRRVTVRRRTGRGREFYDERSCRMSYRCLNYRLARVAKNAGLRRLTPHMLRHTYLTRLYNIRQDLRFVQDQAGHRDPKTTAIYAQTANWLRREQVQQLKRPAFITKHSENIEQSECYRVGGAVSAEL